MAAYDILALIPDSPSSGQATVRVPGSGDTYSFPRLFGLSSGPGVAPDVLLSRDAANALALRNSTTAQTFGIYNTYTDGSNYERGIAGWSGNVFQIGAQAAGSGTLRNVNIVGAYVGINTTSPEGILHLNAQTSGNIVFNSNAGGAGAAQAGLQFKDNGVLRWELIKNSLNEFKLSRYNSSGVYQDQPISVGTAGIVTLQGQMTKSSGVTTVGPSWGSGVNVNSDGKVGVGLTTITAQLHLQAGTATASSAPLKLTAGTNLTTPENGAFEYDGTNLYFTTGGTRRTVTLT